MEKNPLSTSFGRKALSLVGSATWLTLQIHDSLPPRIKYALRGAQALVGGTVGYLTTRDPKGALVGATVTVAGCAISKLLATLWLQTGDKRTTVKERLYSAYDATIVAAGMSIIVPIVIAGNLPTRVRNGGAIALTAAGTIASGFFFRDHGIPAAMGALGSVAMGMGFRNFCLWSDDVANGFCQPSRCPQCGSTSQLF